MQFLNSAYLLIGGNEGDRLRYLQEAVNKLNETAGEVTRLSAIYETAPWGNTNQSEFLNQALQLNTRFEAAALMSRMLHIEQDLGRKRSQKNGPRTIDIDMLLFNDEVHTSDLLTIPHKELENRRFALLPLAEIAGEVVHPMLKKTIAQLLEACNDMLPVRRYQA